MRIHYNNLTGVINDSFRSRVLVFGANVELEDAVEERKVSVAQEIGSMNDTMMMPRSREGFTFTRVKELCSYGPGACHILCSVSS
jgi:hypothetical protein